MDCRAGQGPLFVRAQHDPGLTGPLWYEEHWSSLDRDGMLFEVKFNNSPGTGRVRPAHEGFQNASEEQVEEKLAELGRHERDFDYNVSASLRQVIGADYDELCDVVTREWDPPEDLSGAERRCNDGVSLEYHLSTSLGEREKEGGCLRGPVEIIESNNRIHGKYMKILYP